MLFLLGQLGRQIEAPVEVDARDRAIRSPEPMTHDSPNTNDEWPKTLHRESDERVHSTRQAAS
jgi:hypothetical protein